MIHLDRVAGYCGRLLGPATALSAPSAGPRVLALQKADRMAGGCRVVGSVNVVTCAIGVGHGPHDGESPARLRPDRPSAIPRKP